ncbi:lysyl-trna synthetase : Lysine--tRNA ligase OS=Isosphaera pallida (strain ATCC 43644 / DSM 9630 / IS1B) GN=lysS PE=3 SV=1: tRNA_anti-codon: tRNA-synt_2 [Tuwongella immobilis]|uniref:Lysine--tRNA ligase n=1 Tax=Tuwongella immobilis TaxID=692036 RepID=A0A6C2YVZ6_9BACT|nr:lysyl-trna synthetase : Lysine--tRNA ligase OS=Isosphaera pallida (strain ATCC 43644 / DSM 9630 / IS1B) GN=lysS PE=3 SV=1: tRNA_anti-codon: tRNA-synt_2 [Tuwongella immobilis]VTS08604.1 lysyl-trna synthetase : Lysine--tRNA ligase OS=Isosphaera pallida (strain ATCC 43644 / DSM 9630 / IS1B) GN=lysS PE=3 SV=1: tRNA_anti-codon: tRNA-synt_2 [Tuwongella immobilis]
MAGESDHSESRPNPNSGPVDVPRIEKLHKIEELGLDPWGGRFDGHQSVAAILEKPCVSFDENPTEVVRAAGRIVLRRNQGKVHFLQLWDQTGRIQIMMGQAQVGELGWKLAQLLDLGDLIGVEGVFGHTRKGEPTIRVSELTILSKSLEPHPEKYHGLSDIEYRLRHRYLDLIYTPETMERAKKRILILRTIRNYLDAQGYMEVETPVLHTIAGGAAARPFATHHNALDIPLVLRIALELHLKRLLVGGIEKVYEIGRVFRNEGISHKHNPEFTMMELYQAYGDYRSMMDLTEGLMVACVDALGGGREIPWGEKTVKFEPPFERAKYADLFLQHVGCSMDDPAACLEAAKKHRIDPTGKEHDVLVNDLFERCVEDNLVGPVFVYDYPAALCPLTKRKRENPAIAERFELYVHGMELANAYTELNDPITQEATFARQLAGLKDEDSMAKMDHEFVWALRHAMPPAGGLGIGMDRLIMLLTNTQSIRDVILFPLLRPER